ncbi:glutamate-5-semialdehyde dehydrogenase [Clostridium folliculivorans]|uniref:Gamma-glutamyl phosphate reductase n=1 Tax=Clostridium folliculivorans TaxID=2886038 RepID=A0A9W5Y6X9_9CLOT|nr:glutamate-5-semialdehyde dehydrogenase [Clostridium folliculivorans]GKU27763.1 gamma-glutamyl phosphate reductase [Clostridium folliculivorans]GKU32563.1 gamma-glutamyl phosphate reductase [Clostridium folliculivorans]
MDYKAYMMQKGLLAKAASRRMASVTTEVKNKALLNIAKAIRENTNAIISENAKDIENGKKKGLSKAILDRLFLDEKRIEVMASAVEQVSGLNDPIGEVIEGFKTYNELKISKIRVPLGVVGIIYEARPNVTIDAAALCIKSGNSCILRGGSEAINSNIVISGIISKAATESGLPNGAVTFVDITDREIVDIMLKFNECIDVLIPRGGANLIRKVVENATVPVIETGVGNCHVFVDESADVKKAIEIIVNAKTHRPGVCNAIETILVHKNIAENILGELKKELEEKKVQLRGCEETRSFIECEDATEEDWATEYLDLILAVKVVNHIDEALDHIYKYGTKHSEAIITENYTNSQRFLKEVDAAAVYVNASTRFTDGGEFGFGAEIGISTQKLHARGPMGLKELTSYKYLIYGDGQIRK